MEEQNVEGKIQMKKTGFDKFLEISKVIGIWFTAITFLIKSVDIYGDFKTFANKFNKEFEGVVHDVKEVKYNSTITRHNVEIICDSLHITMPYYIPSGNVDATTFQYEAVPPFNSKTSKCKISCLIN